MLKDSVIEYCARIGANPMLVQGAGGNVSWKDGDSLWIKASGTWLADAVGKDIFVPVDLNDLQSEIKTGNFAAVPKLKSEVELRPSIETLLHALMPHRVVMHVHAIEPLVYLVRQNSEIEISQKLKSDFHWKIVDYQKPGEALAKAVANAIRETPDVKVLLLQNHGVVIGGNDVDEMNNDLNQLLSRLSTAPIMVANDTFRPESIALGADEHYVPVDIPGIHSLALNPDLYRKLKANWALYPDHVVFLGSSPTCIDTGQLRIEEQFGNDTPELIFVKGKGVFTKPGFSLAKQAQLRCYFEVIVRQSPNTNLKVLDDQQIAELLNWDAERYRQKNAKQ